MPVCIAGMHRSGTSMVTRILHLNGLYLGQEAELGGPAPDNADGFWEHVRFRGLNEAILNELGGGWDCPPPLPEDWSGERFAPLRTRANRIVQDFEDREPWGWKDPRNCLTLPFWLQQIPGLKVVIVLRNPLEVAFSLRNRGASSYASYAFGLVLWDTYNRHLLHSVSPDNRIITHYDAFFHQPATEVRRVLDFLEMPVQEDTVNRTCTLMSAGLRHQRFTYKHLVHANASPKVVDLYRTMSEEAGWIDVDDETRADLDAGRKALNSSTSFIGAGRLDVSVVEQELQRQNLAAHDATIRESRGAIQEQSDTKREASRESERASSAIVGLGEHLSSIAAQLNRLQQAQDALSDRVATQGEQLEALDARVRLGCVPEDLRAVIVDTRDQVLYHQLILRIKEVVRDVLPRNSTVLVVSNGDDALLLLDGRRGWHFLQVDGGVHAGHLPADSAEAINHLEALRAKGADYLLFPDTELWWLDHYTEFRYHVETHYPVVVWHEGTCLVFGLRELHGGHLAAMKRRQIAPDVKRDQHSTDAG